MTLSKLIAAVAVVGFAVAANAKGNATESTEAVSGAVSNTGAGATFGQSTLNSAAQVNGQKQAKQLRKGTLGTSDAVEGSSQVSTAGWDRVVEGVKGAKKAVFGEGGLSASSSQATRAVWKYTSGVVLRGIKETEQMGSQSSAGTSDVANAAVNRNNKSGKPMSTNLTDTSKNAVSNTGAQTKLSVSNLGEALSNNPAFLNAEQRGAVKRAHAQAQEALAQKSSKSADAVINYVEVAYKAFNVERDARFEDAIIATLNL